MLLSLVPASFYYCIGLYLILLLFVIITFLASPRCPHNSMFGAYVNL